MIFCRNCINAEISPEDQRRNVELSLEDYNKQNKFSPAFIRRLSETSSRSFHSWLQARTANSFSLFKDDLQAMVALKKEEAELAGYEQHPYNALLDNFEKGCTTSLLDQVFSTVRVPAERPPRPHRRPSPGRR